MLVRVVCNRFGHLELSPKSGEAERRIRRMKGDVHPDDSLVYLQSEDDVDAFLSEIPRGKARDVRAGWDVTVRMSDDTFAAYCGV